jgi:cell division septal protein FtsQ
MDDKIRVRRRSVNRQRGRRRMSLIFPLVVLVCAGALFLWLRSSDVFAVHTIAVSSTERVTEEQIADVTADVFGESLLRLSTGDIEEALLTLPYVSFAEVHRRFPNTLEINVLEYDPVARLQVESGGVWLVSEDGRVLEGAEASRFDDLPLVVPALSFSPAAGEQVPGAIVAALPAAIFLQTEEMRERLPAVEGIRISAAGDVVVVVAGGVELRLGQPSGLEQKLTVAAKILDRCRTNGEEVEYVDASVPDRVAVKPK